MEPNSSTLPTDRLTVTIPEAARLLGVSRESAYKAARAGQIPTVAFGRRRLVPVARLRALLGLDPEGIGVTDGG